MDKEQTKKQKVDLGSQKPASKKKCVHEGHRSRLSALAIRAGLDNMSDVQVMEQFLTYIFPRGDVNPLAHTILERYDSFSEVVDADIEDLKHVCGIGERAATMIHLFGDFVHYYMSCRASKIFKVASRADVLNVVEGNLRFRTIENVLILAISAGNIITHRRLFTRNDATQVGITTTELTNFINSTKLTAFVIAHCHPFGSAQPSKTDWDAFECVKGVCSACGVNFIDSFIVGEDGIFSQRDNKFARQYQDLLQPNVNWNE